MLLCNVSNLRNNLAHNFCPNKVNVEFHLHVLPHFDATIVSFHYDTDSVHWEKCQLWFEIYDTQFKSLLLHCLPLAWKSMREGVCHPECCLLCWRQSSENKYINKSDTARHLLSKLFFDWLFECHCLSGLLRLVLKIDLIAIRFTLSSSMRAKSSYLSIHGEFATKLRKKIGQVFA